MLQGCVLKITIYEWYKSFKEGQEDTEDNTRFGCQRTSINDENFTKLKNYFFQIEFCHNFLKTFLVKGLNYGLS